MNNDKSSNLRNRFTDSQVIEIYKSTESIDSLSARFGCTRYNIITIKRKIYYRSVTQDIPELPGFNPDEFGKGKEIPIPIDYIEKIFYDTGDYKYFWEKYRATYNVVQSIKKKKTWKKITSSLGTPGQIKRYKLTNDEIEHIIDSKMPLDELADFYGVHKETIRNIKKGKTRNSMWDDF